LHKNHRKWNENADNLDELSCNWDEFWGSPTLDLKDYRTVLLDCRPKSSQLRTFTMVHPAPDWSIDPFPKSSQLRTFIKLRGLSGLQKLSATLCSSPISAERRGYGFPFRHGAELMKVDAEGGTFVAGRNEKVGQGRKDRDKPLQTSS
jgi:hypothetical protein